MPAMLRRINRIFRRNSRDQSTQNMNNNNQNNANAVNNRNLHRHRNPQHNINTNAMDQDNEDVIYGPSPIKLRSTGYQRQSDGSVTLSVTLDKDQVECCVCLSSMTCAIYRCRGSGTSSSSASSTAAANEQRKIVCHNICSSCQWQMRRMKSGNGHTKQMQCPICKVKGKFVRNLALERQLLELSQECVHSKYGCMERFFPWDDTRKLHEKHLCVYQPIDCPFCYQTISGGRVNFVEHLAKSAHITMAHEADQEADDDMEHENMDESQSMMDEEMNNSQQETDHEIDDSENELFEGNDDDANNHQEEIEEDEEDEEDEEEEQKQGINEEAQREDEQNKKRNEKIQYVPPCKLAFYESKACLDLNQTERNIIKKGRNEFIVNYNLGIILCFVAPTSDCQCWKVYALSISPRHGIGGNSRVYIQYCDEDKMSTFMEKEQSLGLITQSLTRPVTNTLILTLARLHPTSLRKLFASYPATNAFICEQETKIKKILSPLGNIRNMNEMKENDHAYHEDEEQDEQDEQEQSNKMELDECDIDDLEQYRPIDFLGESPCSQIQCGFIYAGHQEYGHNSVIHNLSVRLFTLEQSLKVGSVIDARDFTGKWYQAEVIAVKDSDGNEYNNLDHDNDDYLEIRKAKIHYLGYSQNYDEWLFVDTDSHRIAQRGTFTVGPDLRAIRRNTTNLANSNAHPIHRHHHHHLRNRHSQSSANRHNNNNNNNNNNNSDQIVDIEPENGQ